MSGDGSAAFQEGSGHVREGRWAEAVQAFQRALALRPGWFSAEANLGVALRGLGRFDDAVAAYDRAIALRPEDRALRRNRANALADRGVELRNQERPAEALPAIEKALADFPDDLILQRHRANLLIDLGRHDEALAQLDAVLAIAPNADSFIRKGLTLQREGRHDEAIAAFEQVGDDPDAALQRSMSLLALGRFEEGWATFERRWDAPSVARVAAGNVGPVIRGRLTRALTRADLTDRRLLIVGEQGVGDVLMFASVLPDLLTDAAEVTLLSEPRLCRLFAASFPDLKFAGPDVDLTPFDHVVALGSLCSIYRKRRADFPGRPFLAPSLAARTAAAERLGPRAKPLRVGLSWRGGTKLTNTDTRSIQLELLKPLLAIPDVEFVSLQYGDQGGAEAYGIRVLDPDTISDFDDLAATVLEMDLIVSVQTTLIHLAGALGARTLVMVPYAAEWRYGTAGETMPWYGSVRLFRQGPERDWAPVIERVAAEVREHLAGVHFQRGRELGEQKRFDEALVSLEAATRLRPDWPDAHANQGVALSALGQPDAAIARFGRAIALQPDNTAYRLRRSDLAFELERFDDAIADLEAVLSAGPSADAFERRGLVRQKQGRHEDAVRDFDLALGVDPTSDQTRLNRGISRLALGRFAEGWRDYDLRGRTASFGGGVKRSLMGQFPAPASPSEVAGKSVVVVHEQGIGDNLMFATALPDLIADAKSVAYLGEPRLLGLMANSFPALTLLASRSGLDTFDIVLPIGSLPGIYRHDAAAFPGQPVLKPTVRARRAAAERLGPRTRPRIGLSWRGGVPRTGAAARSIQLELLKPLLAIPDVEFVSLQYGDQGGAEAYGIRVLDPDTISDFDDLAATVLEMDLIVSVQTTLIHLAGALGARTLVMVPYAAEWRYGTAGETMPWYGSVRLFRQGPERDWAPVIERVAAEVRGLT